MQEKSAITTIYVYLLNEGTDVWRPVDAIYITGNIYRISPKSAIPETETWKFLPGEMVCCEEKQLSEGKYFVAIEKVKNEPI